MKKLKMHSPNFAEGNIARLADLFPGCATESKDENGNLKKAGKLQRTSANNSPSAVRCGLFSVIPALKMTV
ncbi:MAG: hypothetical protein K9L23_18255 [Desulfotignum sp.]|nr:hypothetical protein [Desulfotignum sp.]